MCGEEEVICRAANGFSDFYPIVPRGVFFFVFYYSDQFAYVTYTYILYT